MTIGRKCLFLCFILRRFTGLVLFRLEVCRIKKLSSYIPVLTNFWCTQRVCLFFSPPPLSVLSVSFFLSSHNLLLLFVSLLTLRFFTPTVY